MVPRPKAHVCFSGPLPGQLVEDHVVVRAQSEANRIHNKGHYGRPLSGGGLRLDLLEACYLAETERLEVQRDAAPLEWADLLVEAGRRQAGFEILYLVYRDLRERGYLVHGSPGPEAKLGAHFRLWGRGTERPREPSAWVRAVSERSRFSFPELHRLVEAARKEGAAPRLCVVDEESDLTYYELASDPPSGPVGPRSHAPPVEALLLEDRVLVPQPEGAKELHAGEFFGKPVAGRLQLSLVETLHLVERGDVRLLDAATRKPVTAAALRRRARDVEPQLDLRHAVYVDLKRRGLIVKTGFKFGTHFRAYEGRPEENHAPHLVQAVAPDFESPWEPLARAIRLSHSVRKRLHLAAPRADGVDYLAFGRFRP
jgi:tRNA-intron endonuclease, archaea type